MGTILEISLESLNSGDTLASSLRCSFSYKMLLPKDTVITKEHLSRLVSLKAQGHCLVLDHSDVDGVRLDLLDRVDEKLTYSHD